jgi:hypothetical protein
MNEEFKNSVKKSIDFVFNKHNEKQKNMNNHMNDWLKNVKNKNNIHIPGYTNNDRFPVQGNKPN